MVSRHSPNLYNSFEQCNRALQDTDAIDIVEYIEITQLISCDYDIAQFQIGPNSKRIKLLLEYLIDISKYDARAFRISISSLEHIGFSVGSHKSHLPQWIQSFTNSHDGTLKQEKRFLKSHKLIENIDYIENINDVDGQLIVTGHSITRTALYKLLSNRYGIRFIEAVLCRMSQIIYFYNDYRRNARASYIDSLKRTVVGLNEDIKVLNSHRRSSYNNLSILEYDQEYNDDAYSYDGEFSSIHSDAIMNDQEYADELSIIHKLIESTINRVDGRISDIHVKLSCITTKIDELVSSIANVPDDMIHSLRSTFVDQPIIGHVHSIFREYQDIGNATVSPMNSSILDAQHGIPTKRHTYVATSHQL